MSKKHFSKAAILAAVSALAIAGCASSQDLAPAGEPFRFSAENAPGGILLVFENIPAEASSLSISVLDTHGIDNFDSLSFGDIRALGFTSPDPFSVAHVLIKPDEMEQVRRTGSVLFPFAREGRTYSFGLLIGSDLENWHGTGGITATGNGMHVVNDVALELNSGETAAALSGAPGFWAEARFADPMFEYAAIIMIEETEEGSSSVSQRARTNELVWAWDFAAMVEDLSAMHDLDLRGMGPLPAQVLAHANIIHDNLSWDVVIARSREFAVYF